MRPTRERSGRGDKHRADGSELGRLIVHTVAAGIFSTTAFLAGEAVIGLASMALTGSAIAISIIALRRAL
jgi:hypothetical protein